jgi:hypothetical protein
MVLAFAIGLQACLACPICAQVTVVQSFDGIANSETPENFGSVGADTTIAAGIDHLISVVNRHIRVINKADGTSADGADLADVLGVDKKARIFDGRLSCGVSGVAATTSTSARTPKMKRYIGASGSTSSTTTPTSGGPGSSPSASSARD